MADGDASDGRVQFSEESVAEAKSKRRLELTQRYDRKEVQKRLDIENWMDQQMKNLYECEVCSIICIRRFNMSILLHETC